MSGVTVVGHGFPPLFILKVHDDGENQTLTIDFERYVTNAEVTAFLNDFGRHPFIVQKCELTNHPKHRTERKLLMGIQITFYPNITKVADIPEFVRTFAGLVEGVFPKPPKRMSVWERIRHPLV